MTRNRVMMVGAMLLALGAGVLLTPSDAEAGRRHRRGGCCGYDNSYYSSCGYINYSACNTGCGWQGGCGQAWGGYGAQSGCSSCAQGGYGAPATGQGMAPPPPPRPGQSTFQGGAAGQPPEPPAPGGQPQGQPAPGGQPQAPPAPPAGPNR